MEGQDELEKSIELWKVKRLIQSLEKARGNGTSLISLIIPPKEQLPLINRMITEEHGKAANIKSRVVRQAVQSALVSVKERLKLYNNKVPQNGLIVYCGEIINDEGVCEKKYTFDLQPFRPINTSLYLCDNKFETTALKELLETDDKFGFIIVDGNGALYGTLQGNTREVLHKFTVDLPKKHRRGGQSSVRFARLRMESRHNYLRKVAEQATVMFITNDRPNITGLVLAGSAEFKKDLYTSDMFDQRLQPKVINIVDISYGGENGFNQAIELSSEALTNVKFIKEKKVVGKFFEEVSLDSRKYCYGVSDTIKALTMGAIETIILFEGLETVRVLLRDPASSTEKIMYLSQDEEKKNEYTRENGVELETVEKGPLAEWIVENYTKFGAMLEFITDKSQEGMQFVRGFGGIGGFLRYQIELGDIADEVLDEDWDEDFM